MTNAWFAEYHATFSLDVPVSIIGETQTVAQAGTVGLNLPLSIGAQEARHEFVTAASLDLPIEIFAATLAQAGETTIDVPLTVGAQEASSNLATPANLDIPLEIMGTAGQRHAGGTVGLSLPLAMTFAGDIAFTPFSEVNTLRTNVAVPGGAGGCWVTMLGGGAGGGKGFFSTSANRGGGGGGGGGSRVGRSFVPRSAMGATYSVHRGVGGTTNSNGGDSTFASGGVTLTAQGGRAGQDGTTAAAGNGGAGGTASAVGVTAGSVALVNGTAGGNGGAPGAGVGVQGVDNPNGAGPGGGGSGGLGSLGQRAASGRGGNSIHANGGASVGSTGGTSNPGGNGPLSGVNYTGPGGGGSGASPPSANYVSIVGGSGGQTSAGGGGSTPTNTGTVANGGTGGDGYSLIEWVRTGPAGPITFDNAVLRPYMANFTMGYWIDEFDFVVGANAYVFMVVNAMPGTGYLGGADVVLGFNANDPIAAAMTKLGAISIGATGGGVAVWGGNMPAGTQRIRAYITGPGDRAFYGYVAVYSYRNAAPDGALVTANGTTSGGNPITISVPAAEAGDWVHGGTVNQLGTSPSSFGGNNQRAGNTTQAPWVRGGDTTGQTITTQPTATTPWAAYAIRLRNA